MRWLLLTSEPVATLEQALKILRIYAARWRVEDFHKAWKSGAGAERQRMVEPEHLERMVSILGFVAVRLMQLRESFTLARQLKEDGFPELAKQVEATLCDSVLTQDEWPVLWKLHKSPNKPKVVSVKAPPSLQWAYLAIAKLGGFADTKRTGIADWAALWEGWDSLQTTVAGYIAVKELVAEGLIEI